MNGRGILVALLVALALTTVAGFAQAGEQSGIETIDGFDPLVIEIDATEDGTLKVNWDIKVTDGVPINVFMMPEEGYEDYNDPLEWEFAYYPAFSMNYTQSFKKTAVLNKDIVYYMVIESAHSSMDTSTVDYEVTWDESSGFWATWCWPVVIVLVLIFGIGIIFWLRSRGVAVPSDLSGGASPGTEGTAPGEPSTATLEASPTRPPSPSAPVDPSTSYPEPVATDDELSPDAETVYIPETQGDMRAPDVERPSMPQEPSTPTLESSSTPPRPPDRVTELGPQPEPPDTPPDELRPTGEGATQLSPQPEPPDMPTDDMRPTGEVTTELSPQPEPPDLEAHGEGGHRPGTKGRPPL